MNLFLAILTTLYAGTGIISAIGYLPTIKDLAKGKASANIPSYWVWTACSLVSFLYASFIIKILLVDIVTGLNLAFCAIILFLSIRLPYKKKKN